MPSVYTFSHSDSELLSELLKVLGEGGGNFREQWSLQAEAVVEPVGWEALWKLSKEFCQKLGVRFPCVAYVCVTGVDFENLSASLEVRGVQHERVCLPTVNDDVPLIELWPTIHQSEQCIDAHSTAEFINILRFYYNNIWMPWDELEERVILPETVRERMTLWASARDGSLPARVSRRVALLRLDAVATYRQLREADSLVDPAVDRLSDSNDSMLPDSYMSRCAELHARLGYLLTKWTNFENPHIRASYLAAHDSSSDDIDRRSTSVLWEGGSVRELQRMCEEVTRLAGAASGSGERVAISRSPEEALASSPAQLLCCGERYEIPDLPLADIVVRGVGDCTLVSPEVRSCLLFVTGEVELHDLTLNCSQVNTALVVRHGSVLAKNCRFIDDSANCQSDFVQGVVVMSGARLVLDSCTFHNLYTGVVVHSGAQAELRSCEIEACGVGVQMFGGGRVQLARRTRIGRCLESSVRLELETEGGDGDEDMPCVSNVDGLEISSCSVVGSGDEKDVCIVRQDH